MKIETSFRSGWLGIFALILLFVALRWNNFNAPLIRDEGDFAYAAQLLIHGVMPYDHAFTQKPPMTVYCYALASLLFPGEFWAPRLLACAAVALATLLLGYVARLEFGKGLAVPTMALATPMILLPGIEQFTATAETFMLLPLLATFAVYVHARHHGQKTIHWLAAGVFGFTTLCFKYTALPLIAFVFAVWLVESWRQTRDARRLWKHLLAAVLGGGVAAILELGIFLLHDGGARFWECTVQFNRYYVPTSNFGWSALWFRLETFWPAWWILCFIPFAAILKPKPHLWFWIGLFACSLLATSASPYGQYYVPVMPLWALLSAVGLRALAERLAPASKWMGCLMSLAVVILVVRPDVPWMICTRERFAEAIMNGYPFRESLTVATRVTQLSSPDDFVFVAGSEPQILCYAKRFSPTRFVTAYPYMMPTAVTDKYQREVIHDLMQRPPALIVYASSPTSWERQETTPSEFFDFFWDFLLKNYGLVGGYVIDGQNNRWSEPFTNGEFAKASLVLYERKKHSP